MNIRYALARLAVAGSAGLASVLTFAAAAEDPAPQRSLTIPLAGPGAQVAECVVAAGPAVPVAALAFSPDGKMLATGGYREVLLWDLENAALLKRIGADQIGGSVAALAFLKDRSLAVGEGTPYGAGAVRIFDVAAGKQSHVSKSPRTWSTAWR